MRKSLVLLSAAVLAALAGRVEATPNHGTPVNSGDTVTGAIDSAGDRDLFRIAAPDGSRLQVVVKAAKKSLLLPDLGLLDPAGNVVDLKLYLAGQSTGTVSVPVYGVHQTGTWTVAVTGYGGTIGAYQLVVKVVTDPKVLASVDIPAGETVMRRFTGVDGALVDFTVTEKGGAGLDRAEILDTANAVIPGTAAVRKKTRLQAKKIALAGGDGLYSVALTGSSLGSSTVDLSIVVRFPKMKAKKIALGTEPRPAAMAPWSGRNGTPFVLTGTGFMNGARIVFGNTDEATEVEWISATEMHGLAPEGDASRLGSPVPVSVLNPDGQYGSTAMNFAYIGIPGPTDFVPKLSPLEGGVLVSVAGTRFRPGYSVEVGGIPSPSVVLVTPSHLTFLTPAGPAGNYDVVVKDEFGRAAPPMSGLWYSATPTVTSANPSALSSLGGVPITLVGTGMVPGVRVFVGGTEASIQSQILPTSLTFLCPEARSGPVEVEVRDPLNRSFKGNLLTMTRALHDESNLALPAPPSGAEFWGDIVNIGDMDLNGRPEILVTSLTRWTNPVNGQFMPASFLFLNNGSGAFTDATSSNLPAFNLPLDDGQGNAAVMGDLDGDGRADAALVRNAPLPTGSAFAMWNNYKGYYDISYPTIVDLPTVPATRVLKADAAGKLQDRTDTNTPAKESTPAFGKGERFQGAGAALGDLDNDGDRDLIVVCSDKVDRGVVSSVRYTYFKSYSYYYGYYYYKDKAILTQTVTPRAALRVLENLGTGVFKHTLSDDPARVVQGTTVLDDFRGSAVAVGDLNGDGKADAVVVSTVRTQASDGAGGVKDASALRVLLNNGTGAISFSAAAIPAPLGAASPESDEWWQGNAVTVGDFDGDGDRDIAVGRSSVKTYFDGAGVKHVFPALRIFRNNGAGVFTEATAAFLAADLTTVATDRTLLGVSSLAPVDFDGDGDTDLVITGRVTTPTGLAIPGGGRMATRILLNDGASGLRDATADWMAAYDFQPADGVAVGDLDGDGKKDLVIVLHGSAGQGKRSLRVLMNR